MNLKNFYELTLSLPQNEQIWFQQAASPVMEGIIDLQLEMSFHFIYILVLVIYGLLGSIIKFNESKALYSSKISHWTSLERVYSIIPMISIICIYAPSFSLLYAMDEYPDTNVCVKIVGRQWYWHYELSYDGYQYYKNVDKFIVNNVITDKFSKMQNLYSVITCKNKNWINFYFYNKYFLSHNSNAFEAKEKLNIIKNLYDFKRPITSTYTLEKGIKSFNNIINFSKYCLEVSLNNELTEKYINFKMLNSDFSNFRRFPIFKFSSLVESINLKIKELHSKKMILNNFLENSVNFKELVFKNEKLESYQIFLKKIKDLKNLEYTNLIEAPIKTKSHIILWKDLFNYGKTLSSINNYSFDSYCLSDYSLRSKYLKPQILLNVLKLIINNSNDYKNHFESIKTLKHYIENDKFSSFKTFRTSRLLETSKALILPTGTIIRGLVTSSDVIHSWAIPSLGIKTDGIPGRINQVFFSIIQPGIYYGQCSELCGQYHFAMPIVIKAMPQ